MTVLVSRDSLAHSLLGTSAKDHADSAPSQRRFQHGRRRNNHGTLEAICCLVRSGACTFRHWGAFAHTLLSVIKLKACWVLLRLLCLPAVSYKSRQIHRTRHQWKTPTKVPSRLAEGPQMRPRSSSVMDPNLEWKSKFAFGHTDSSLKSEAKTGSTANGLPTMKTSW